MYKNIVKRLLDIIVALLTLPFVMFVFVIIAPIIYINDRGPVFYRAPRRGHNGKIFMMLKFRSMYINSLDLRNSDGSTYNSENDPRVTRVGRFMRKTSIDELPQIINVLLGDMSLIGPRPTLTTKPYDEFDYILKKRLAARPGLTGYSQAYHRNNISQSEKYHLDCFYVDNLSFVLDIKILAHTIKTVLRRKNIYAFGSAEVKDPQADLIVE